MDAAELTGGKVVEHVLGAAGDDDRVDKAGLADALGRVGDADGLVVDADPQDVGLACGCLDQESALAATQVEADLAEAARPLGSQRRAGLGPAAGIRRGKRLDRIRVAVEAFL